jgi:ribonuclease BN (tRNA processing enzyme)
MRVTVLGSSASYSGAFRACAGHYLEAGGARVLLDCGNGVLSNLAQLEDPTALDAVFITHNHPDHYADLYVLHAALRYSPEGPRPPMPLYLPPGLWERIPLLLSERGAADLEQAFVPMTLVGDEPVQIGELTITPIPVEHTDPTFALVAEADCAKLTYTADTAPCGGVERAARGADLLLAEATLAQPYEGLAPHMTAKQAGQLACDAGVRALALVHVWPTNDRARMARDASSTFGSQAIVAEEFDVFEINNANGRDD